MANFFVGVSDGYHSIAFASGLEPASRQPFSITEPVSLPSWPQGTATQYAALAEVRLGTIADHQA